LAGARDAAVVDGDTAAHVHGELRGCANRQTRADRAQFRGDFVTQHLLQAEAEEVRCVAAVGTREDVAAEAG
jgi:hypothetical protein